MNMHENLKKKGREGLPPLDIMKAKTDGYDL